MTREELEKAWDKITEEYCQQAKNKNDRQIILYMGITHMERFNKAMSDFINEQHDEVD